MTRCSYIPPEGQSVIAIAKERGGTTEGDIAALVDRFGCKAEARWEISSEASGGPWKEPACSDHVGHLLHEGANDVKPYVPADVAITIANTHGVAREGFGSPMILAPNATRDVMASLCTCGSAGCCAGCRRTSGVDLGTNPTREQIETAGFSGDSAAYREALARLDELRRNEPAPVTIETSLASMYRPITVMPPRATLQCVRSALLNFVPGVTAAHVQTAGSGSVRLYVDGGEPADIALCLYDSLPVGIETLGDIQIQAALSDGSVHDFAFTRGAPPYAVGDEVEWRPGLSGSWTSGKVTSVIDDAEYNDADDWFVKRRQITGEPIPPLWIICIDTAPGRRFTGPVARSCLRRPGT